MYLASNASFILSIVKHKDLSIAYSPIEYTSHMTFATMQYYHVLDQYCAKIKA